MNELINLSLENGKYTVHEPEIGRLEVLRYGVPWRDLTGDNLFYNLVYDLNEANIIIAAQNEKLNYYQSLLSKQKANVNEH